METKKILLVDDEPDFCELLREFLAGKGYQTTTANSGTEALTTYEQERPDLVLLDIVMPDMCGLEVLRKLKTLDPKANVVMVSAVKDDDTGIEALKYGTNGYITKPVDGDFFLEVVAARVKFANMF
jgi:DNA-binding response OmpR family regulator